MEIIEKDTLIIQVKDWASVIDRGEFQKLPDRKVMRAFFELCGFNFKNFKGNEESMKTWTSKGSSDAMKALIGVDRKKQTEAWMEDFILLDEAKTGIKQKGVPLQDDSDKTTKISGLKGVLHLLARWAAFDEDEDVELNTKKIDTEIWVRMKNGFYLKEGAKEMRMRIMRPDTGEMYRPGSFPPGFVGALLQHLSKTI